MPEEYFGKIQDYSMPDYSPEEEIHRVPDPETYVQQPVSQPAMDSADKLLIFGMVAVVGVVGLCALAWYKEKNRGETSKKTPVKETPTKKEVIYPSEDK